MLSKPVGNGATDEREWTKPVGNGATDEREWTKPRSTAIVGLRCNEVCTLHQWAANAH